MPLEYGIRYKRKPDPQRIDKSHLEFEEVVMPVAAQSIAEQAVKSGVPVNGWDHEVVARRVTEWQSLEAKGDNGIRT
ncbi:hypothetical protein HOT81_gp098 [Gordonia phage Fryberger]|nr:hypothetical protein HOT81_gp098 [Gordonia phage Fryberger]AXN53514.1 hypothetical protein SEA_FRYBERGER_98 [Gordonia phage Fryberger]